MVIYIDNENKCHVANNGTMRGFETDLITDFFTNKCVAFIEGHIYTPIGEAFTRSDGEVFTGEMISPFVDSRILMAYQEQYEANLAEIEAAKADLADADAALGELGVEW